MSGAGGDRSPTRTSDQPARGRSEAVTAQRHKARAEAFSYVCNRCSLCCQGKVIQVNPYEIARLARGLGVSTAEFRERWTEDGAGAHLTRRAEDDTCSFLGPQGCTVHPDRPLVCRIYPLGRHVAADGTERWSHLAPHPQTRGVYAKDGTIADYLAAQDAADFMQATDDYAAWLRRAYEVIGAAERGDAGADDADLLDLDSVVARHCQMTGAPEPLDIEARKALHLTILAEWLENFAGGA
jgi:hypothetical protein